MGVESAGLRLPLSTARALVVEAVGPGNARALLGNGPWLRNVTERRKALRELFDVIGFIHEEEYMDREQDEAHCPRVAMQARLDAIREGENCLDAVLSFLSPAHGVATTPTASAELSQAGALHASQANVRDIPASVRLAVTTAPMQWQLARTQQTPCALCLAESQDAARSVELVSNAVALFESLMSAPADADVRQRVHDVSLSLKALRKRRRRHRFARIEVGS
jgi:hypothetical protein